MCDDEKKDEVGTVGNMRTFLVPFYDLEVAYSGGELQIKIPIALSFDDPMLPKLVESVEQDKRLAKDASGLSPHQFSGIVKLFFTPEFTCDK